MEGEQSFELLFSSQVASIHRRQLISHKSPSRLNILGNIRTLKPTQQLTQTL